MSAFSALLSGGNKPPVGIGAPPATPPTGGGSTTPFEPPDFTFDLDGLSSPDPGETKVGVRTEVEFRYKKTKGFLADGQSLLVWGYGRFFSKDQLTKHLEVEMVTTQLALATEGDFQGVIVTPELEVDPISVVELRQGTLPEDLIGMGDVALLCGWSVQTRVSMKSMTGMFGAEGCNTFNRGPVSVARASDILRGVTLRDGPVERPRFWGAHSKGTHTTVNPLTGKAVSVIPLDIPVSPVMLDASYGEVHRLLTSPEMEGVVKSYCINKGVVDVMFGYAETGASTAVRSVVTDSSMARPVMPLRKLVEKAPFIALEGHLHDVALKLR